MTEETTDSAQEPAAEEKDPATKAQEGKERHEAAEEQMRELEKKDELPSDPSEWPSDEAKYVTFGGGEGDHGYDEGPEKKLGPSSVAHHEDGSVSVEGEKVDNPEDYKGEPIPGGPTDPNAPALAGEEKKGDAGESPEGSDS